MFKNEREGINEGTEIGSGYCATLRPFCLVSFLDIRWLLLTPTQFCLFVYPFIENSFYIHETVLGISPLLAT